MDSPTDHLNTTTPSTTAVSPVQLDDPHTMTSFDTVINGKQRQVTYMGKEFGGMTARANAYSQSLNREGCCTSDIVNNPTTSQRTPMARLAAHMHNIMLSTRIGFARTDSPDRFNPLQKRHVGYVAAEETLRGASYLISKTFDLVSLGGVWRALSFPFSVEGIQNEFDTVTNALGIAKGDTISKVPVAIIYGLVKTLGTIIHAAVSMTHFALDLILTVASKAISLLVGGIVHAVALSALGVRDGAKWLWKQAGKAYEGVKHFVTVMVPAGAKVVWGGVCTAGTAIKQGWQNDRFYVKSFCKYSAITIVAAIAVGPAIGAGALFGLSYGIMKLIQKGKESFSNSLSDEQILADLDRANGARHIMGWEQSKGDLEGIANARNHMVRVTTMSPYFARETHRQLEGANARVLGNVPSSVGRRIAQDIKDTFTLTVKTQENSVQGRRASDAHQFMMRASEDALQAKVAAYDPKITQEDASDLGMTLQEAKDLVRVGHLTRMMALKAHYEHAATGQPETEASKDNLATARYLSGDDKEILKRAHNSTTHSSDAYGLQRNTFFATPSTPTRTLETTYDYDSDSEEEDTILDEEVSFVGRALLQAQAFYLPNSVALTHQHKYNEAVQAFESSRGFRQFTKSYTGFPGTALGDSDEQDADQQTLIQAHEAYKARGILSHAGHYASEVWSHMPARPRALTLEGAKENFKAAGAWLAEKTKSNATKQREASEAMYNTLFGPTGPLNGTDLDETFGTDAQTIKAVLQREDTRTEIQGLLDAPTEDLVANITRVLEDEIEDLQQELLADAQQAAHTQMQGFQQQQLATAQALYNQLFVGDGRLIVVSAFGEDQQYLIPALTDAITYGAVSTQLATLTASNATEVRQEIVQILQAKIAEMKKPQVDEEAHLEDELASFMESPTGPQHTHTSSRPSSTTFGRSAIDQLADLQLVAPPRSTSVPLGTQQPTFVPPTSTSPLHMQQQMMSSSPLPVVDYDQQFTTTPAQPDEHDDFAASFLKEDSPTPLQTVQAPPVAQLPPMNEVAGTIISRHYNSQQTGLTAAGQHAVQGIKQNPTMVLNALEGSKDPAVSSWVQQNRQELERVAKLNDTLAIRLHMLSELFTSCSVDLYGPVQDDNRSAWFQGVQQAATQAGMALVI